MYSSEKALDVARQVISSIVLRKPHRNAERVIPNIYGSVSYTLLFNHEPVSISIDATVTEYPAFCCFLWDESHQVYYNGPRDWWTGSWLSGNSPELRALIEKYDIGLNRPIYFDDELLIERYFTAIAEEFREYQPPDYEMIAGWLNCLFLELRRVQCYGNRAQFRIPPPFLEVRNYLELNLDNPEVTLCHAANHVHLEPSYLSRSFRKYFGISPINYLISRRLSMAAQYLKKTDLPVQEIAAAVGYRELFHFSKIFKKHFGISPAGFRKNTGGISPAAEDGLPSDEPRGMT